jgi:hypothetical protein
MITELPTRRLEMNPLPEKTRRRKRKTNQNQHKTPEPRRLGELKLHSLKLGDKLPFPWYTPWRKQKTS